MTKKGTTIVVGRSKERVIVIERYVPPPEERRPDPSKPDGLGRVPAQNTGGTKKVA